MAIFNIVYDVFNIHAPLGLTRTLQLYSKTCLKQPLKNSQNKGLNGKW